MPENEASFPINLTCTKGEFTVGTSLLQLLKYLGKKLHLLLTLLKSFQTQKVLITAHKA